MPALNWVGNQPIVSEILTKPSSRKQFAGNEKGPWKRGAGSYLFIHLHYRSVTDILVTNIEMLRFLNRT